MPTRMSPLRLAKDQQAVQADFMALIQRPRAADHMYNSLPESRGGKVISVDVARFMSQVFQTWDGRIRHTPSTSMPAGVYAHERLLRELRGGGNGRRLLITAGGAGAGKTTAIQSNKDYPADLIFDNQMRNKQRARIVLKTALANNWMVDLLFVHRPFTDAVRAVVERSQRTGRWNLLAELPYMHAEAQQTLYAIWRAAQSGIVPSALRISVLLNSSAAIIGDSPAAVEPRDMAPTGRLRYHDPHGLAANIPGILQEAVRSHSICPQLAEVIGQGLAQGNAENPS